MCRNGSNHHDKGGGIMAIVSKVEMDNVKKKYRGKKIVTVWKGDNGLVHVRLASRKRL